MEWQEQMELKSGVPPGKAGSENGSQTEQVVKHTSQSRAVFVAGGSCMAHRCAPLALYLAQCVQACHAAPSLHAGCLGAIQCRG